MTTTTRRPLTDSPLLPSRWPAQAFTVIPTIVFVLALAAALLAGQALTIVLLRLDPGALKTIQSGSGPITATILIALAAGDLPLLALCLYRLPVLARRSLRDLGFAWPTLGHVGFGIAGGLLMFLAVETAGAIQYIGSHITPHEQQVDIAASLHGPLLIGIMAVFACVIAPLTEEFVFRGFLFNAILRLSSQIRVKQGLLFPPAPVAGPLIAAILSAVIFAASHAAPTAFFPLACGGVVLAFVYFRSGSLVSSMISHGLFNAISFAAVLLTRSSGG
jgi:membrane protease YdiL (CAAX protease family)